MANGRQIAAIRYNPRPRATVMSNPIPDRVGRYEVVRLLARGSLGPVYLARDSPLGRQVAIKVLLIPDAELTRRAAVAARSASRLNHPSIVTIYDVAEEQGQLFIAMEYVDGERLADIIRRKAPLSMARRLELIQNLCDGLAYAHRMGVVHTRLHPGQLFVMSESALKIPLLGLARLTTESMSVHSTNAGPMIGTPQYMSPEQISGREIDHRTDIFSVGLILYETVTYSRAFAGTVPGVFVKILTEEPRLASQLNPSIDVAIEGVIAKALQKAPADRYQTMSDFAKDLARIRLRMQSEEDSEETVLESPAPRSAAPRQLELRRAARIESLVKAAREHLIARQYSQAIAQCESALLLDPEHREAVEIRDLAVEALDKPIERHVDVQTPRRIDNNVQFSVFRPAVMAPAQWYSMVVFAHLAARRPDAAPDEPDPLEEVARRAKALLGHTASAPTTRIDALSDIPEEGQLRMVPWAPGLKFDPPQHRFLWLHPVHQAEFNLRANADMEGRMARGFIDIYLGALAVAHVPMAIPIDSRADRREPPVGKTVSPYRRLFASYSHKDEAIVRQFENYAKGLGDRYVRDVVDLRAGERWNPRLCELIESADVFQLFWSQNSMESAFVRQEWEHALTVSKPEFVRPVYWELPFPKREGLPPARLADLQFAFVGTAGIAAAVTPSGVSEKEIVAREHAIAHNETERRAREEAVRREEEREAKRRWEEDTRRAKAEAERRARDETARRAAEEAARRRAREEVEERAPEEAERPAWLGAEGRASAEAHDRRVPQLDAETVAVPELSRGAPMADQQPSPIPTDRTPAAGLRPRWLLLIVGAAVVAGALLRWC